MRSKEKGVRRHRLAALVAVGALCALGWTAGCSSILGIDSNRYVDAGSADVTAHDVAADEALDHADAATETGPWDCLGQQQHFTPGATTVVTFLAVNALQPILQASEVDGGSSLDLVEYTPYIGVPVRDCATVFDPSCEGGTWETTDDAGIVTFTLPQNWNGFYEFNDPSLVTTTFYPGPMLANEDGTTVTGTLVTNSGFDLLGAELSGVQISNDLDGGLGHAFISVYDCQDHFASGVQFIPGTVNDGGLPTVVFYVLGSNGQELPTVGATSTDQGGTGGILNAPVGIQQITAILPATSSSPKVTLAQVGVLIHPAVATLVSIRVRTESLAKTP